jgi:hypothetical protein
MKINLSLAVIAAVATAVATLPAEAASKKKSSKSGKAAKVTVAKSSPYYASSFNACYGSTAGMWFPIAAIGAVGCGIVYAIPVAIEGFVVPQGGGKA